MSHKNTFAPFSRHSFAVAQPIPVAPAEIIIFLLLKLYDINKFSRLNHQI